jgi:subtilisin family serine protease
MPQVHFGRKDEPATTLNKSSDLIAVRTHSTRSLRATAVAPAAADELRDAKLVLEFPEAGVEVYRLEDARPVEELKRDLVGVNDVRFAGGVLIEAESGEPVVYTENVFIKFVDGKPREECVAIIEEAGLYLKEELDYATNAFFAAAPEGTGTQVFDIAASLLKRDDVEYCHPEVVRERRFKAIAPQQWHLVTTTINGVQIAQSANVAAAHMQEMGQGITIAIIDDGVDIAHPEFNTAGKIVAPFDATLNTTDPNPKSAGERHGTACAGVACADGRNGASGVAPRARLMPIRLSSGLGSVAEGRAFKHAADNGADIISCSWGPADGRWWSPTDPVHNSTFPLPASSRLAIDYAVTKGRGGKGCVVLFAAGNGNESVDNDGYASYANVIAVAACNDRGTRSVYSDFGAAVWCAFPSSDMGHAPFGHPNPLTTGIWTTDRVGSSGYNPGDTSLGDAAGLYTNDFGGTSSACPGVAGVAALVLSANPALTWTEVRNVLRDTCQKIDTANGGYVNGRSAKYGYGRVDAAAAVALARQSRNNHIRVDAKPKKAITDFKRVTAPLAVVDSRRIVGVAVDVDIKHTYIGDLVVRLVPPSNSGLAPITLHRRAGGSADNIKRTFDPSNTPGLSKLIGVAAGGTWTLEVVDQAAADSGSLEQVALDLIVQ